MTKFRVGDRVRLVSDHRVATHFHGAEFVVSEVTEATFTSDYNHYSGGPEGTIWSDNQLELVAEAEVPEEKLKASYNAGFVDGYEAASGKNPRAFDYFEAGKNYYNNRPNDGLTAWDAWDDFRSVVGSEENREIAEQQLVSFLKGWKSVEPKSVRVIRQIHFNLWAMDYDKRDAAAKRIYEALFDEAGELKDID